MGKRVSEKVQQYFYEGDHELVRKTNSLKLLKW